MNEYIFISIAIIAAIYGTYYLTQSYLEAQSKNIQKIKAVLEKYGTLKEEGKYFKYIYQKESFYILFFKVSKYAKLTFNSQVIWEKRQGNSKQFTDQTVFSKLPGRKMVIVYPNAGPFMYHYDENEIKFITPSEKVWDYYIMAAETLDEILSKGIK